MFDLIIFIKHAGANVRHDNLSDTINSLFKTCDAPRYGFYFVTEDHLVNSVTSHFTGDREKYLLECRASSDSWAADFNNFFTTYKDKTKWVLISHDDVEYSTDGFFKKIMEKLKGHEDKIGWVTGSDTSYLESLGQLYPEGLRPDLYLDAQRWGTLHHLHNMSHLRGSPPQIVKNNLHLLDYPKKPVKIVGPMSCMMMIQAKALDTIGPCVEWGYYTMLIDIDWSLEALRKGLYNVWVPDIFYKHPLRKSARRDPGQHRKQSKHCLRLMKEKWGFNTAQFLGREKPFSIAEVREKYKGTLIEWFTYKNSYDWAYLDEE